MLASIKHNFFWGRGGVGVGVGSRGNGLENGEIIWKEEKKEKKEQDRNPQMDEMREKNEKG